MHQRQSQAREQWDPDKLRLTSRNLLKIDLKEHEGVLRVEIPFYALVGKTRKPRLLILAGIHGDEYEGVAVLHDLAREINPKKLKGILTLVPVANPQAFGAGTRRNPIDLGDLNRSFPGSPDGPLSERLAHRLFHELVLGNDCLMSMHGWSKESLATTYVEYPIGTSEACRKSYEAARALGQHYLHPYVWPKGLLGEAALKHGIACVEPEVGGMGRITREGQSAYRNMVYRLLSHWNMLPPSTGIGHDNDTKIIDHVDILAARSGLFRSTLGLGEEVKNGQLLGEIFGLGGKRLEELRAPRRGFVGVLRTFASVQPGDRLVQLFYQKDKAKIDR
jgi:predicted deacylase